MREIIIKQLGLMKYQDAWDEQERIFQAIIQSKIQTGSYSGPNYILCVEHPPVYTIGRKGDENHLLVKEEFLLQKNIDFIRNNRGGDITFHGPGQLVIYPILDLDQFFTDLKKYMRLLEEVVIRVLKEYNIIAERSEGETGVWLEVKNPNSTRKICALGVRTSRWVSMHGLALNVNVDLQYFKHIIPCGISNKQVTSMEKELHHKILLQEVFEKWIFHFQEVFDAKVIEE